MKFPAAKLLATVTCSLSLLGLSVAPTEACCFLSNLFCCGNRYGSCYAPSPCGPSGCGPSGCATYYAPGCSTGNCGTSSCSTGACGSTAYYAPAWGSYSSCGTSCAPCGTGCSSFGGSCASGDCAVSSASPTPAAASPKTPAPAADPNWRKKTYAEPENGSGSGSTNGTGTGTGSPAGGTRTRPEGFREEDDSTTGFKPPMSSGDIQQAGGEEQGESVPVKPRQKSPAAPSIPDDDDMGTGAGHLPTLNLDEKIAWRPAPERKRVELKVRTANARLIRVPAYPKSDWTPVDPESKVARK